jgi:hypothetical protein
VRRNNNTDTPLPPEEPAGQNPPDGAVIDYFLKSSAAGVTIEISDESGKPIRRFSSTDKPEPVNENDLNIPTYWIRPPRVLSSGAGMHRFVWDLRYPPPDAVEHEYPISAIYHDTPRYPLGPAVVPGRFTVKLTVDGKSYLQTLTINIDPRVKTPIDGLRQQFELESKIVQAMHLDYEALQEVRRVRQKLKVLRDQAGKSAESVTALEQTLAELEGTIEDSTFLSTPEGRSLTRLNVALNKLLSAVDSADVAPTPVQMAAFDDVSRVLSQQLDRWREIETKDVPALTSQLRRPRREFQNTFSRSSCSRYAP